MAVECIGDDPADWQVAMGKKGGKSKKKQAAAVPELQSPRRKEERFNGSPSMLSVRSACSTKDTDGEPGSLPLSPAMLGWSETVLDESVTTEEAFSLQGSSSGASLEDGWQTVSKRVPNKGSKLAADIKSSSGKPFAMAVQGPAQVSAALSHALESLSNSHPKEAEQQPPSESEVALATMNKLKLALAESKRALARVAARKSSTGKGHIVDRTGGSELTHAQQVPKRTAAEASEPCAETHSSPRLSNSEPEPLASEWVNNGRRDEGAEWRLLTFQPLWSCAAPDIPHIPVSIKTVEDPRRLVIKQTFLHLECDHSMSSLRRRASSLDPLLLRKKAR